MVLVSSALWANNASPNAFRNCRLSLTCFNPGRRLVERNDFLAVLHAVLGASLRVLVLVACLTVPKISSAAPYNLTVLHGFIGGWGPDGEHPRGAALIRGSTGILYGVSWLGGGLRISYCPEGCGAIFEFLPPYTDQSSYKILYSFCATQGCPDGYSPMGSLILGTNRNLYGTTVRGGAHDRGTIFKLVPNGFGTIWALKTLKSFCVDDPLCSDGSGGNGSGEGGISGLTYDGAPAGELYDGKSALYLTTKVGGLYGKGVLYKFIPGGEKQVIHNFCAQENCADGAYPEEVVAKDGWVYGAAQGGGKYNQGVLFRISAATGKYYKILHDFCAFSNCSDGAVPNSKLSITAKGGLFGTTQGGGVYGNGTVFRFNGAGFVVLHSFCENYGKSCTDGALPNGVVMGPNGILLGSTQVGGGCGSIGGDVFRLKPPYSQTDFSVLYRFCDGSNAYSPQANVMLDPSGHILGTTYQGNTYLYGSFVDLGTVFQLASGK